MKPETVEAYMFGLGTTELILVLVIVVILFGAGKLPKVGADLAKGIQNFKKNLAAGSKESDDEDVVDIQGAASPNARPKKDG